MKRGVTSNKEHMLRVKALPCCICGDSPSEAHHIREQGSRIGDMATIPLCLACHRGETGVHGDKSMLRITKKTELQHMADVLAELYA